MTATTTSRLAKCRDLLAAVDFLSDRRRFLLLKSVELEREIEAKETEMHELMRGSSPEDDAPIILDPLESLLARQSFIRDRALAILREHGGRLANVDLARLLGVDGHGLNRYLAPDPRFAKDLIDQHRNQRLWWVLVSADALTGSRRGG